jgi:hypothetical protein
MKITYNRDGGIAHFPGLSAPISVDTATLPAAQAERLEQLCADAQLFERPQARPPSPPVADAYAYTLTIQQGRRRRTLQLHDPVEGEKLQALLEFLEGMRG